MLIVILCALGTLAIISTVSMMALFIHSGNLSRAEEEQIKRRKEQKPAQNERKEP